MVVENIIKSDLESNRVQDLELVLSTLTTRFVEYVKLASSAGGKVGAQREPKELVQKLKTELPFEGSGPKGLFEEVDQILENSVVTWHEGFLDKLYASNNPVGVASDLLLSILNTNSHVFTVSPAISVIEKKVGKAYAELFGFTGTHAGGLTFPGGSYSNMTSLHMARSLLFPETKTDGNQNHNFAVFASSHCHYSVTKAAIFCGLGSKNVISVKVNSHGEMDVDDLEHKIEQAKKNGLTPLYINATAGSTVYGSYDDFEAVSAIAKKYRVWFHIDGSWGGNVVFSNKQKWKLKGSEKANSITVNPHKMLGVPCTCSFLLVPDEKLFQRSNSLQAPYLFHSANDDDENFDLADGTMGCGRRADAVKFYLAWKWYGSKGFEERIDHAFAVTEYLAKSVSQKKNFKLISQNPPPCLQTCFYYAPGGEISADSSRNSNLTRFIAKQLYKEGKFLIDYAPHSDGSGEFFRVVVNAPIVSSDTIDRLLEAIEEQGGLYQG